MSPRYLPPDFVEAFRVYGLFHYGSWGNLHIAFEDGNLDRACIQACAEFAREDGDTAGQALAEQLAVMRPCQIVRLYTIAQRL